MGEEFRRSLQEYQQRNEEEQVEQRPLKGYKNQNLRSQQTFQVYQQQQIPYDKNNSDIIKQQNYQHQQIQDNNFEKFPQQQNIQSSVYTNRHQNYRRDEKQMLKLQDYQQQFNKINYRNQIPQQQNICYQFQTQFLRANNYYNIQELRANFKTLEQLNNNHFPPQNSFFVLIRPKNGFQNIHKAIKYGIWCSTPAVNKELSELYSHTASVYLIFFPLGQSSKLIGIAQMTSDFDPEQSYKFWDHEGIYKGSFQLIWHYIKNVDPNCIEELSYQYNIRDEVKYCKIDQFRDGTIIQQDEALKIFEIFNQASDNSSVFELFNALDIQEDQKRNNVFKNQEKVEDLQKQKKLNKKYQY
ncbi:unnamed protein product [Paramecium sonneborni]|uniref:YTH domain-containing protein n=1 Tax=Paramecium sonneborni TaxID=65129 RepID=A0A8S1KTB9_9CILI|nr:unnamed protein product [Paramecium sonneborni]